MKNIGLDHLLIFMEKERDHESGLRGCFNQHWDSWEFSEKMGYNTVLILESDNRFYNFFEKKLDLIKKFIKINNNWDIIRLNYPVYHYEKPTNFRNIWVGKGDSASSYILSKKCISFLLKYKNRFYNKSKKPDYFLSQIIPKNNQYILTNPICYQDRFGFGSNVMYGFIPNFITGISYYIEYLVSVPPYYLKKSFLGKLYGLLFSSCCYPNKKMKLD